jgi:hypothetical protein
VVHRPVELAQFVETYGKLATGKADGPKAFSHFSLLHL